MPEQQIISTGSRVIGGILSSTASISQLDIDGYTGSFSGSANTAVSASHALQADSASHALQADSAASASHALQADVADSGTGSFTGSFIGEFTGSNSFTGSFTGAVAVLSSASGKAWDFSIGPDVGGKFNANSFSLAELGPRFAALVDQLMIPYPPPDELPALEHLTLYYDVRQQGDTDIIQETINANNVRPLASGSFTYRQDPPSVDLESGINATDPEVLGGLLISGTQGVQTMMILVKPHDMIAAQYIVHKGTAPFQGSIRLSSAANDIFEFFATQDGDSPSANTGMTATESVWQTVCYVIDVDGANKQNGYINANLNIGPLNKTFALVPANDNLRIGHLASSAPFTGSFGGYAHWTSSLTAAEVVQAHNYFRSISVNYGLPEA